MRSIKTVILRLLVDPAEPEILRGALQPLPEGETQPFVGEEELLAMLYRMASPPGKTPSGPETVRGERMTDIPDSGVQKGKTRCR